MMFVFLCITSCNDDDSSHEEFTLVGNWKLIEIYIDEGGGVENFLPIESDKIISFSSNGIVTSNGDLCSMSDVGFASTGTYSEVELRIYPTICESGNISNWPYAITLDENYLIISYPCFEPCQEKYVRI